jgi:hypothetical protein
MGEANVSAADFRSLFDELCTWGRWGTDDERGTLHLLTPERLATGARGSSATVSP